MRKILAFTLSLFLLFPIFAKDNKLLTNKYSIVDVESSIQTETQWVSFPSYADREEWDKLFGEYRDDLIRAGERLLDYKWQVTTFTSYLEFRRSGSRTPMEATFNANIRTLSQLLLAELAEGKGRFLDQIIDGSMMLCEMTSWSLSAHLVVQPSRSPMPNHKYDIIDLVSGELSSLLAWTNFFLKTEFDKVEPEISQRILYELNKKTIEPYMDGEKFWWIGFGKGANGLVNNWNPWCNSNVLTTALLTITDKEKLSEVVYKTMKSVDQFFNYIKSDGACEEGPSYWQHAAGKAFDYLYLLDLATDGKISIFDNTQIKDMGEYIAKTYIGDGWMVNFADAEAKANLNYYHIYRYGKAVESQIMMEFASYLNQKQYFKYKVSRDFFDTLSSFTVREDIKRTPAKLKHEKAVWYPETQFFYLTNSRAFFATKGGHNDESHNHNDVGTFLLYVDGSPLLVDVGVGTYTAKTFSSRRYELWNLQSKNHNLPVINGVDQKNGKKYKAQQVVANSKQQKFSLDIANAYPEDAAVKYWNRSYDFKTKELVVKDQFELLELKANNIINFIAVGEFFKGKDGELLYELNGNRISLLYNHNQFNVEIVPLILDDPRFIKFWGEKLYKISFKAKEQKMKDTYTFKIKY